ncbi:hypothetical protein DERP_007059, partial [Dermatophagoides pteronyssinus]
YQMKQTNKSFFFVTGRIGLSGFKRKRTKQIYSTTTTKIDTLCHEQQQPKYTWLMLFDDAVVHLN